MSEQVPRQDRLELRGIRKAYPAIVANDDISLRVAPGEIHAIVGENGAGKSTLMKVIYGIVQPDEGEMLWNGREVSVASPAEAQRLGIGMVFQHFALFDTFTVAENIALAMRNEPSIDDLSKRIVTLADKYGLPVDPGRHIYNMSVGERQRVEIIRALLQNPGLLILDEPTSVLTPQAVETLFVTLRQLAAEGCSILYISHKLGEIQSLCDRATILRGGKVVGACNPREESPTSMARMMIGGDLPEYRHKEHSETGTIRLQVANLSVPTDDPFGTALSDISLEIHGGEIFGIAGVSGNGQQELLAVLSGEQTIAAKDAVQLDGKGIANLDPRQRRARGLCSVPEDRLGRGSVPSLSLAHNALLTVNRGNVVKRGMVDFGSIIAFAKKCIADFDVRCSGPRAAASSLSGGNLQKFIVGREILQTPSVLIISQPTWGVDVGAAMVIRQALLDLRDRGAAILVISEELDELFEISDRIAVIAEGRLTEGKAVRLTNRDEVGLAMAGKSRPETTAREAEHALAL